ncbi:MAG: ABC transporter ATP-binding protein [Pseudomonadota bacterium]
MTLAKTAGRERATPAGNAPPVLTVEDLVVEIPTRRGILRPVDGVSLSIAAGEILGVVGESGAGKSMMGSAVIGLLDGRTRIAGGQVRLAGERIDHLGQRAMRRIRGRRIGMVFQDPLTSLNPLIRIGDQLVETIRTHLAVGWAEAKARALALLHDVGIPAADQRMASYPHQFSGGMRQRVVIALALAAEPELVIADEPTTALDVSVQAQIIALLRRLCRERGAAVMLITHDMGVIAEAADRVAVLYAGRLAEIGPVAELVTRPLHPYTEGLLASTPMATPPGQRLNQIPGAMPRLDAVPDGCAFHPRCPFAEASCRAHPAPTVAACGGRAACRVRTRVAGLAEAGP